MPVQYDHLELQVADLHDRMATTARAADRAGRFELAHSLFGILGELDGWERYLRFTRESSEGPIKAQVVPIHHSDARSSGELPF